MIVALHSGGIDSTVLLYELLDAGHHVVTVGFNYGQHHVRELDAAEGIARELGVTSYRFPLPAIGGSTLTDTEGTVVVPGRNLLMLSMAASLAMRIGAETVAIACHSGDHALFPDCRPGFLDAAHAAIWAGSDRRVRLMRPYVHLGKLDIVRRGIDLGVPLDRTWSCYTGGTEPCGECLACRERREALMLAGAPV